MTNQEQIEKLKEQIERISKYIEYADGPAYYQDLEKLRNLRQEIRDLEAEDKG